MNDNAWPPVVISLIATANTKLVLGCWTFDSRLISARTDSLKSVVISQQNHVDHVLKC